MVSSTIHCILLTGFYHIDSEVELCFCRLKRLVRTAIFGYHLRTLEGRTLQGIAIGVVRISYSEPV
jgi:hypothetical protein